MIARTKYGAPTPEFRERLRKIEDVLSAELEAMFKEGWDADAVQVAVCDSVSLRLGWLRMDRAFRMRKAEHAERDGSRTRLTKAEPNHEGV